MPMRFMTDSTAVARSFLQTVVFLDDHAFDDRRQGAPEAARIELDEPESPVGEGPTAPVLSPTPAAVPPEAPAPPAPAVPVAQAPAPAPAGPALASVEATAPAPTPLAAPVPASADQGLDAKQVIEEFAKRDLICAVLQPERGGDMRAIKDAARRADIVVLDWVIHGEAGAVTKSVVSEILDDDKARGGRLRLFAIYTIEGDLHDVVDQLREHLRSVGVSLTVDDPFTLGNDTFRLVVLAKTGARTPDEGQVVAVTELPARLHEAFAGLSMGLIRNVALRGLAVLRDNTHELLAYLGRDLDPAFVAHRVLLPDPDDSADHAVEFLANELAAMLQGYDVRAEVSLDRIRGWLASRGDRFELTFDQKKPPRKLSPAELDPLLAKGVWEWTEGTLGADKTRTCRNAFYRTATQTFFRDSTPDRAALAERSNLRYASATSLARQYDKRTQREDESRAPEPTLRLGTIVRNDAVDPRRYLVCIQPLCDSVRLDDAKPTVFAFLEGLPVTPDKPFDIVVEEGPEFQLLKLNAKVVHITTEPFVSVGNVIRAVRTDQGTYFRGVAGNFRWIGQLKESYALRVAHRFGTQMTRVGVNESEWLRQCAKHGD